MENLLIKNKNAKVSILLIIGIVGVSLFMLFHFFLKYNIEYSLTDSIITATVFAFISLSLQYPINYISVDKHLLLNVVLNNLIIAIIATALWLYLSYLFISLLLNQYNELFVTSLFWRTTFGLLLFIIVIILNYVIIYYTNFTEKVVSESELNSLVKEAELKSLKYQINPHFIFNALNSISSLTISNPEKAQEMSINLSDFLRKTLSVNDQQKIPLDEEIKNIHLYLEIEKVRFEERLEFNFKVEENCKNTLIPNMILQPLVENAIKHGVYESSDKVAINLLCSLKNDFIEIKITNNYDPDAVSNIGEGIGLSNINSRLKLIYNKTNLVSISKSDNIFSVTLLIPIEEKLNDQ